jgi:hypothetical protein
MPSNPAAAYAATSSAKVAPTVEISESASFMGNGAGAEAPR